MPIKYYEAPEIKTASRPASRRMRILPRCPTIRLLRPQQRQQSQTHHRPHPRIGQTMAGSAEHAASVHHRSHLRNLRQNVTPKTKRKPSFTNSCTSQAASEAAFDPTKATWNAKWLMSLRETQEEAGRQEIAHFPFKLPLRNCGEGF